MPGVTEGELADAAQLASLADETPEGRSIVVLAKEKYRIRGRDLSAHRTLCSCRSLRRRGCPVSIWMAARSGRARPTRLPRYVKRNGGPSSAELQAIVERIARAGGTPLVVAERTRTLGVVHLKDIVKGGMRQRFDALRAMGIRRS